MTRRHVDQLRAAYAAAWISRDEHATVGELGEQPVDGLLEPEQPLLDHREGRRRRDRLGVRPVIATGAGTKERGWEISPSC
jgi:hypothetical protein